MAILHPPRPSAATGLPPWPATQPMPPRRRGWVGVVAALAITTAGGGVVGATLTATTTPAATPANPPAVAPGPPAPSTEVVHAQDVNLCTTYAITNATQPKPSTTGMDVLAADAMMRVALLENRDASPEIRAALTDVVTVYDADMADFARVRRGGLVEPPVYRDLRVQKVYDRAWSVCGLDR